MKTKIKNKYFLANFYFAVLSILLLTLIFIFSTIFCNINAEKVINETLNIVYNKCTKYDNYNIHSKISNSFNLYSKTSVLEKYIDEEKLEDNAFLKNYAQNEDISGIIVLDSNLIPITSSDDKGYFLFKSIIERDNVKDILNKHKKVYMDSTKVKGEEYDFVVLYCENINSLILSYNKNVVNYIPTKTNNISFENMLSDYKFKLNCVAVVANKEKILSSNEDYLQGLDASSYPVTNMDKYFWNQKPYVIVNDRGNSWYGNRAICRDYYLYAFVPEGQVYFLRKILMLLSLFICLCFFLFFKFIQSRDKIFFNKLEKGENATEEDLAKLNAEVTESSALATEETENVSDENKNQPINILLIEDNKLNMEIAELLLEKHGAVVTKAFSEEMIIKLLNDFQEESFQGVFIDMDINFDTPSLIIAKRLKKLNRSLPIIAMTENKGLTEVKPKIDSCINKYIAKPINEADIKEIFSDFLNKNL